MSYYFILMMPTHAQATQFEQSLRSLLEERIKKNGGSPSFSEVYLAFPFKLILVLESWSRADFTFSKHTHTRTKAKTNVSNMNCFGLQDQVSVEQVLIFMGTGDEDVAEKASNKLHIVSRLCMSIFETDPSST